MGLTGTTDPAFAPVADAFAALLADPAERGAALAVLTADGRTLVDLAGGTADAAGARPWLPTTRACVFSAGKGALALLAHRVPGLALEAPVERVWPGFGKAGITVLHLLDHSAGLPAIRASLPPGALFDWTAMTGALAAEEPWWEPGTGHGYHLTTFGWLVGEVLRRATGRTLAGLLAEHLPGTDLTWGATPGETVAELTTPVPIGPADAPPPSPALIRAVTNPPDLTAPGLEASPAWRAATIPASNGYASARGLATMYAALLREPVDLLTEERRSGPDQVLGLPTRFSAGLMLPSPTRPFGRNPRVAGHPGTGGTLAFADLDAGLTFAFVPGRQLTSGLGGDPRWQPLLDAVYAAS